MSVNRKRARRKRLEQRRKEEQQTTGATKTETPKPIQKSPLIRPKSKTFLRGCSLLAGGVSFLSALASIYYEYIDHETNVTIDDLDTTRLTKPFDAKFIIENKGSIRVHDVDFLFFVGSNDPTSPYIPMVVGDGRSAEIPILESGERHIATISYIDSFKDKANGCKLGILLEYRPDYWPYVKSTEYDYILKKGEDGTYAWLPTGSRDPTIRPKPNQLMIEIPKN